jgi:hypothetical protein
MSKTLILAMSLSLFACGGAKTGETACLNGALTCSAGQYCNESALKCTPGCTSDLNCAGMERCQRAAGEAVGACAGAPMQSMPSGKTLVERCRSAAVALEGCGLVEPSEYAALDSACTSGFDDQMRGLLATCVEAAGEDCKKAASCAAQ